MFFMERSCQYLLSDGENYIALENDNIIFVTNDINMAHIFSSTNRANKVKEENELESYSLYILFADGTIKKIRKRNVSKNKKLAVFQKGNCKCYLCGKDLDFSEFTVDHVELCAKGGTNDIDNLLPACKSCNNLKAQWVKSDFYTKMANIILYQMKQRTDSKYKMNCMRKWLGKIVAMQ